MFDKFDFAILDDPEFKEDAVREELIVPLLNRLGYTATGEHKITRSKALEHPFVAIGSKAHKVNIFPDYLLKPAGKAGWILDAKAPDEDIVKGQNVEQAYSYAIHPDVRVPIYALCNGRHLTVFHISKLAPELVVSLPDIEAHWKSIEDLLNPVAMSNPAIYHLKPDLGLTLAKIGERDETVFDFPLLQLDYFVKEADGLYSVTTLVDFERRYMLTLDFTIERFEELLAAMKPHHRETARFAMSRFPYQYMFEQDRPAVTLSAIPRTQMVEKELETFLPFEVVTVWSPNDK